MKPQHPLSCAKRLAFGLAACGLLVVGSPTAWSATAESSSVRLSLIGSEIDRLPFGGDVDAVMGWVRSRLETRYGPQLRKALDSSERADIRQRMEERLDAVRRSAVAFDGARTGYEVSIVSGEFMPGARESLMLFREGDVVHYLFFTHGKLWKYARPLPADDASFRDRYAEFVADHGRPQQVVDKDVVGRGMTSASWVGPRVRMHLEDRRLLYRADLLIVEDRGLAEEIGEFRGGRAPGEEEAEVDPDLDDFLE